MARRVTAESLTDRAILRLARGARDGTVHDALIRWHAAHALGITAARPRQVAASRRKIAAFIQARRSA